LPGRPSQFVPETQKQPFLSQNHTCNKNFITDYCLSLVNLHEAKISMNQTPDLESIVRELKRPEIEKVILFGSFASGTAHPDSDIDLMVITTHDTIPQSFRERMDLFNLVYEYLRKIAMNTPIDLIVYSKRMFQELIDSQNMFSKEIMQKGIVLYEKFN
jgi:uncharacterized protein